MPTCPVCNSTVDAHDAFCRACGYRFQDTTERFERVSLDSSHAADQHEPLSQPTLRVLNGRQEGITYQLEGDEVTVGRSPKCAIFLNDMTVSRKHAVLEPLDGGWSIKDTGSFNGVWVNNTNVDHVMLNDRDVIQIGCFVLRYEE